DLRDACGRRRDAGEVEPTQAHVVPGHGAFALEHVDLDARLTVRRGREDFALPCGNRRVPLDQLREDAALRLDAQAQGGHIEQEDVLHLAAEDRGLDRRAERDALHRVDRPFCRPTEDLLESGLDGRHARRPSDQDDMIDVPVLPPAVFEGLANRSVEAIQRGLDQLFELRAGDLLLRVNLPSPFFSRPYANAAAVGSLTSRRTSRPAILPASFVACRWLSLKYAGTVITA